MRRSGRYSPDVRVEGRVQFQETSFVICGFPVLPWEFSIVGEDPHIDHGLGSL
jgi:hypothetical protein